jgi:lysozyme
MNNVADTGSLGCDLSHHNQPPDFKAIKASGVKWVYLKATQGLGFIDPDFVSRRKAAMAEELRVGVYHFLDPKSDASKQAEHFLAVVGAFDLPPALDVESTPGWDALSGQGREVKVSNWLAVVDRELDRVQPGVRAMIYCSMGWWTEYFGKADFSGHPLWLAHYGAEPGCTGLWRSWTAWQFGEHGRVSGAGDGDVDTDRWNGELPSAIAA